jgi:hypothetical protein
MTPDEVVKELKLSIEKDCACRACMTIPFAISLLQDYQKLRERVSVEKIKKLLNKNELWVDVGFDIGYATPLVSKDLSQAIVTYLQQPTEH